MIDVAGSSDDDGGHGRVGLRTWVFGLPLVNE